MLAKRKAADIASRQLRQLHQQLCYKERCVGSMEERPFGIDSKDVLLKTSKPTKSREFRESTPETSQKPNRRRGRNKPAAKKQTGNKPALSF